VRRILSLILAILLAFPAIAQAGGDSHASTNTGGGYDSTGEENSDTDPQPGKAPKPVAHRTPKAQCAGFETRYQDSKGAMINADGSMWAWQDSRCPGQPWTSAFVCVANCPGGGGDPTWPKPPTLNDVKQRLHDNLLAPIARFAPPAEQPDVKAIVGMRFYFSVDPASYQTLSKRTANFPGGWRIEGTLTPGNIEFNAGEGITAICKGPGALGATKEGRNANDQAGCYVVFETVPESGIINATLTIHWKGTIDYTNTPDLQDKTWDDESTTPYPIALRELQAVIESNN
jgi:hypothetical protein